MRLSKIYVEKIHLRSFYTCNYFLLQSLVHFINTIWQFCCSNKEVITYKKDSARKLEALVYNWARRQIHQRPQVAV